MPELLTFFLACWAWSPRSLGQKMGPKQKGDKGEGRDELAEGGQQNAV